MRSAFTSRTSKKFNKKRGLHARFYASGLSFLPTLIKCEHSFYKACNCPTGSIIHRNGTEAMRYRSYFVERTSVFKLNVSKVKKKKMKGWKIAGFFPSVLFHRSLNTSLERRPSRNIENPNNKKSFKSGYVTGNQISLFSMHVSMLAVAKAAIFLFPGKPEVFCTWPRLCVWKWRKKERMRSAKHGNNHKRR